MQFGCKDSKKYPYTQVYGHNFSIFNILMLFLYLFYYSFILWQLSTAGIYYYILLFLSRYRLVSLP